MWHGIASAASYGSRWMRDYTFSYHRDCYRIDLSTAIAILEEICDVEPLPPPEADPPETFVHLIVGERHLKIGDYPAALEEYTKALETARNPEERSHALDGRASVHSAEGNWDMAFRWGFQRE